MIALGEARAGATIVHATRCGHTPQKTRKQSSREDDVAIFGLSRLAARILAVVAVLACASSASAQTTVKIGLAVPNYGPYAPVYVAEELGYYKDNGVKVEITAYRGGGAAQEALAAGAADMINFFPPGVALAVKKGIKEKIVGIGSSTPVGWHIVVMALALPERQGPRRQEDRRHRQGQHHRFLCAVGRQPGGRAGRDHPGRRAGADPDPQVGADRRRGAEFAAAVPHDPAGRGPLAGRPRQGNAPDPAGRVGGDAGAASTATRRRSKARCARSTRRPPT